MRFSSSGRFLVTAWLLNALVYSKAGDPVTEVWGALMDLLTPLWALIFEPSSI